MKHLWGLSQRYIVYALDNVKKMLCLRILGKSLSSP